MYEKLPEQLKKDGRFCLWKYEERNGRMTKVPYQTNGRKASSADKNTFSDFRLAVNAMDGYDGIGMGAFDDFCMVDIDHCVFGGKMTQMAEDIVERMDSYTEFSPSGTGVRIVCKASSLSYDTGRYYINNQKLGLEIYAAGVTKKFCTLTGNVIRNRGVEERSTEIGEILETYMLRPISKKKNDVQDIPGSYLSDDSVVRLASDSRQGEKFKALWNGEIPEGKSHSDADMSLASILAFWCGGDTEQMDRLFRRSGLMRSKWDRVQSGSTYGALTMEKAVAQALDFYRPYARTSAESDFDDMLQKLIELNVSDNSRYPWNDNGSGRLFADVYKDIARYVPERKKWYVYDGTRWIPDIGGLKTMELAKSLADSLVRYALTITDERIRKDYLEYSAKWQSRNYRNTYISDAQSVYPIAMSEFDRNVYYLNCQNGTLDLQTGEFHPHTPQDKLTKIAGAVYDPNAKNLRFTRFVSEVMSGDTEKARFMQKSLGYGLTGDTRYECMFFYYGATTRNGKGTLMESTLHVMGDYGLTVRPETIAAKPSANSQNPTEDIARLAGVRFANISEPRRGLVLNEAQIKSMTGNDTLNARFLHENSFDFKPQFKLYVNTNYLPAITDMTLFSSGRVVIIPFDRHFEEWEQEQNLKAEFSRPEAASAILNWLIEGYTILKEEGFAQPKAVSDSRLWTFDCEGQAEWGDMVNLEGMDNEDDFQRFEVQAYRLSELVRLGLEFASDQSFAIEDYVIGKMARCFGTSEEQAFINGTGENQPTGILHATDGAETGVTTESDSAISYDEIIRLYLSVDKKYRKHGTWLMNDETALALRTLKDSAGNYLWKESDETIFSKPVQIVDSMPSIGKGQKVIAFGDFSNYWLVQRFPLTIRTLKEKFAMRGQVGYLGCEYLDGKLIRKDAVKVLQMAAD